MTDSKTGSKLAQSLRRAKTQQTAGATKTLAAKPQARAKASPRKTAPAAESGSSLILTSRCWPD